MWVDHATTDDPTVFGPKTTLSKTVARLKRPIGRQAERLLKTDNPILHSPALLPSRWVDRINASDADVVNLHWIGYDMLSIRAIGGITKPVVWTLHDMWAFCGAEHYTQDFRWRDGYLKTNRPDHERGFDLNRWTWQRKHRHWRKPFTFVTPSRWLGQCVKESALLRDWLPEQKPNGKALKPDVCVIPNPVDTTTWSPIDRQQARQDLDLTKDRPLLLFGATGGLADPRKGAHLLQQALHRIAHSNKNQPELLIYGQSAPPGNDNDPFPIRTHWLGKIENDAQLVKVYSAADAMIVPSLQDNLPNTAVEAQACGTPVIAFDVGGLSDIVAHQETGYLAKPFESHDLAVGIEWAIIMALSGKCKRQRQTTSDRVDQFFEARKVAAQYVSTYQDVIGSAVNDIKP